MKLALASLLIMLLIPVWGAMFLVQISWTIASVLAEDFQRYMGG